MSKLPRWLLCSLLLIPTLSAATELGCAALQSENEALKARIRELETGLAAVVAPATPVAPPAPVEPGLAPKPAKTVRVVEEEPYSRTGCRPSLFTPIPAARWMETDLWDGLEKGMAAVDVEKLLGVEHYDTSGGGRTKWEYGKCGQSSRAQLLFENGRLIDWRSPNQ